MSVSPIGSQSSLLVQQLVNMRSQLDDLQTQLGTGQKSQTYAGLGLGRGVSVGLNAQLSAISGFDNRSFSAYTSPPLTTVSMPLHDMGIAAAGMLISLIEGRPLTRKRVILPAALVLRESTPPVYSDGPSQADSL